MPTTSTSNFAGMLTPVYGDEKMPWSEKQKRFFQARAHGWEPTKSQSKSTLSQAKAKELLAHEKGKVEARKKGQMRALTRL